MAEERNIPLPSSGNFFVKKTALIVDDEEINVEILTGILEHDFHVLKAYDGQEALDILLKGDQKIDVVLLDVFMPMDGREVLKVRKANQDLRKIPFIVCTSDKNIEGECFHLGVNDFIKKPYENPDIIVARVQRMIELYEDRSILKEVERDKLTNLYNIEFFKKYAKQFDAKFPETPKDMVAISIKQFRLINELYGKAFVEKILLTVARELATYASQTSGLVGIDGEQTFLLYCQPHTDWQMLPQRLCEAVKKSCGDIHVSFAVAIYPSVDPTLEKELVIGRTKTVAEALLGDYTKSIAFYNEEAQQKTIRMEAFLAAFTQALEAEEFQLYFQPKYAIQGTHPVFSSAEVLIRWISPKFGFISPGDFIPLLEAHSLIGKLDTYIMKKAAEYMRLWKQRYGCYIPLSVNLSRADIYRPNLVDEIVGYLDSNGVPRNRFYIEITESAFVEDSRQVIPVIEAIREKGFKVEIDDFGSGYSSFGALADLPFDVLKIDMQFIRAMDKNPKVKDIIKMIIQLAKTMNAVTVCEGVETEEQYLFLKEHGCDVIQGYYFSKPLPKDQFEEKIQKEFVEDGRETVL